MIRPRCQSIHSKPIKLQKLKIIYKKDFSLLRLFHYKNSCFEENFIDWYLLKENQEKKEKKKDVLVN